ncbi:hypothetical protein TREMEDRAFT_34792 [Tremella mesenterica DSM 1558]|uniref:uncharacterized protein n=1 Tax=Tremella mesenterica (strain ATCC 24925 / CBS 8224 / DSM 1558 / NBRC 9311 / NRRL Y-6157 / RJB 2259-6 / UBC 559-6) TaxID=578456 RepID=UPI00032C3300|nr:uncharacterized protein TREMEDRAFT_34792 [Tremella mesenterica DSM 1558]EIW66611.1 hypothetical protein TREMEDRAFT_34792 [Tremella mesenterica DSM 1558]
MPSPPLSILQSLSPRIAVLTSEDVIQSCEANGCRGLEELLRPWEGGTERVSVLSSTLTPTIHPTFPLRFVNYNSVYLNPASSGPNPDMVVDMISSLVGRRKPDEEQHYPLTKSLLLSSRPVAVYETFQHPVGVLLAVSTSTPDPLGTLSRMYQQTMLPLTGASWMDGVNVMRFYVAIHDVSRMGDDLAPAHELLANIKRAHGPHSTLLVINSLSSTQSNPPSPDISTHPTIPLPRPFAPEAASPSAMSQVYASALSSLTLSPMSAAPTFMSNGNADEDQRSPNRPARRKLYASRLSAEDTQRLAALVRELVVQSLVPWMEARVREWNEVYQSNRRGIAGRLFGAGRKLFGSRPSTPSANNNQAGYNTVKGFYSANAIEAISRRLADFAFMLRDYKYASGIYDSLRRDYAQDRAWRYAAAATEMLGLSLLLSHPYFLPSSPPAELTSPFTTLQHTDISLWLEQAVVAYHSHTPPAEVQTDALRATILYYEAWKMIGEWRGVGLALVKSAGEADEVPNAVIIEEAASADVKGGKSDKGKRRRAFHLVMAATRYETAGLKAYSRRCLDRASHIYRTAPWTAAQDRIEYSLGRQAYTLGESDVAAEYFLRLLRKEDTGVPGSQGMLLEDLSLAYEQLKSHPEQLASSKDTLQLPTPVFDPKKTRIITLSSQSNLAGPSKRWGDLESQALNSWDRKGKRPMRLLPDETNVIGIGETCTVEMVATNPLNAPLIISDLTITTSSIDGLEVSTLPEIILEAYETRSLSIDIKANTPVSFSLKSVEFMFHRLFPCSQSLERKGSRLHSTKEQRLTPTYAKDTSLQVRVEAGRPSVQADFVGLPDVMYAGEVLQVELKIRNTGREVVRDFGIFVGKRLSIRLAGAYDPSSEMTTLSNHISNPKIVPLCEDDMSPDESRTISLVLTTFDVGMIDVLALLVFASDSGESAQRLSAQMEVLPIISVTTSVLACRDIQDGYLLSIEVSDFDISVNLLTFQTNNISTSVIQIEDISAFSPYWRSAPKQTSVTLYPNQSSHSILQVTSTQTTLDLQQTSVISALSDLLRGISPEDLPPLQHPSFVPVSSPPDEISHHLIHSRRLWRQNQISVDFPTLSKDIILRLFPLWQPLDLDLIIHYTITPNILSNPTTSIHDSPTPSSSMTISPHPISRRGHSMIHCVPIAPSFSLVEEIRSEVETALTLGTKQLRTMYEETSRQRRLLLSSILSGPLSIEEDPLSFHLLYPSKNGQISHDFSLGSFYLPITFVLQNRSPVLSLRWVLRLPSSDEEREGVGHWIGGLLKRGEILPGGEERVEGRIWLDRPGWVGLKGWEIEVESGVQSEEGWRVRKSWVRSGEKGLVEVLNEKS